MFILIRTISEYLISDIILGVFSHLTDAEQAKLLYLKHRQQNDPWQDQPYRDTILHNDVNIVPIEDHFENGQLIFEVSEYSEGFGQTVRDLHSFHASKATAEKCAEQIDAIDEGFFPHYALIDYLIVGELHSDLSEDQPAEFMHRDETRLTVAGKRKFTDILHLTFPST